MGAAPLVARDDIRAETQRRGGAAHSPSDSSSSEMRGMVRDVKSLRWMLRLSAPLRLCANKKKASTGAAVGVDLRRRTPPYPPRQGGISPELTLAPHELDNAEVGEGVEIFGDLLHRRYADGGGQRIADLADAAAAVHQVQRLIAEWRALPVGLARQQPRTRQVRAGEMIVEPAIAEAVHRTFEADAAIDRAGDRKPQRLDAGNARRVAGCRPEALQRRLD